MVPMDLRDGDSWNPENLVDYRPGLTALARKLVRDADIADDLVQSTFVRALESKPAEGAGWMGWLRSVLINEARQRVRTERRRAAREARTANEVKPTAAGDIASQFESAVLLMNAVRALDPAHREVIVMRYFADLPPRKIAARLGVPVKTIDSRIQRALARLRVTLDGSHGGERRRWIVALAPIARSSWRAVALLETSSLLGVWTVKAVIAAGVMVCGLVLLVLWETSEGSGRDDEATRYASEVAIAPSIEVAPESPRIDESARVEVAIVDAPAISPSRDSEATRLSIGGSLVDLEGRPLVGVPLIAGANDPTNPALRAITDESGRFEFVGLPGFYLPQIGSADHVLLVAPEFVIDHDLPQHDMRLIGTSACEVSGVVVDERGDAVRDAELDFVLGEIVRVQLADLAPFIRRDRRTVPTDEFGRFELARVPNTRGVVCNVSKPGFERQSLDLASLGDVANVRIVLKRIDAAPTTLEGIAFDESGQALPGVRLGFGGRPATSDEGGRFRFDFDAASPPESLLACVAGRLPVEVARPTTGVWPSFLEVRFADLPKAIAGVVLDERGEPLADARVWVADSTPVAAWDQGIWIAESIVRGDGALRVESQADDRGRFRLENLLDREYGVMVLDPRRAWITDAGRIRAGEENIVIRLRGEELIPRLSGRVVDSFGRGVAEASVFVRCRMLAAISAEGMKYYDTATGPSADTDTDGNFTLLEVPTRDATLDVAAEGLLDDASVELSADLRSPLVIVVAWRCDFRVDVPSSHAYDEFELRDEQGIALPLFRYETGSIGQVLRAPLVDGKSEQLAVADSAREIVLVKKNGTDGETIERKPIRLTRDRPNVIR